MLLERFLGAKLELATSFRVHPRPSETNMHFWLHWKVFENIRTNFEFIKSELCEKMNKKMNTKIQKKM